MKVYKFLRFLRKAYDHPTHPVKFWMQANTFSFAIWRIENAFIPNHEIYASNVFDWGPDDPKSLKKIVKAIKKAQKRIIKADVEVSVLAEDFEQYFELLESRGYKQIQAVNSSYNAVRKIKFLNQ